MLTSRSVEFGHGLGSAATSSVALQLGLLSSFLTEQDAVSGVSIVWKISFCVDYYALVASHNHCHDEKVQQKWEAYKNM